MKFTQPNLSSLEETLLIEAFRAGHLCSGEIAKKFESLFTEKYGYPSVVSVNSGSSGLFLALKAAGVGPGDEVIACPYTMVASVNCIIATGATPIFADIDEKTYNLNPESVASVVSSRTKAIVPVDIFGVPCDIEGIRKQLPPEVFVLQDSIEALGSRHKKRPNRLLRLKGALFILIIPS
jgi:perosamine synthetase